jgi:hypothetical protein
MSACSSVATRQNWKRPHRSVESPVADGSDHLLLLGEMIRDRWASWLLEWRGGGDPRSAQLNREFLHPIRDKVLDAAEVGPTYRC